MSRRSQASASDSSLELLLDTICNTFGGVLFISLLVVIILNMTSETVSTTPPDEPSQEDLIAMQQHLAETQREITTLKQAIEQQEQTEKAFATPEAARLHGQLEQQSLQLAEQVEAKNEDTQSIATSQVEINSIAQQLKNQEQQLEAARKRNAELDQRLKSEIEKRSKTAKLPEQRATTKDAFSLFLKDDRLHLVHKVTPYGVGSLNLDEIEESDQDGVTVVDPKPNTGLRIQAGEPIDNEIAKKLSQVDGDRFFLKIFVWQDSFDAFRLLKDALVVNGFEYEAIPMPDNVHVQTGGASSRPSKVQ